ncbi:hypothetical protein [Paragemmobacter kunshanensis]|nr:hypothetical protein [Rhodobacter kunshanensis]
MGQHLGFQTTQNALRKHLLKRDIRPEDCNSFDLIAHGPIYDQVAHDGADRAALMLKHTPLRNQVGAMEKLLCDGLKAVGYNVMNTVACSWSLSPDGLEKWEAAKEAFRSEFPELR